MFHLKWKKKKILESDETQVATNGGEHKWLHLIPLKPQFELSRDFWL